MIKFATSKNERVGQLYQTPTESPVLRIKDPGTKKILISVKAITYAEINYQKLELFLEKSQSMNIIIELLDALLAFR